MESNRLVKDVTQLVMNENRSYGITPSENLNDEAAKNFTDEFTYNAEFVLQGLLAMKAMNGNSLKDVGLYIPKKPYPLIIDNGIQCYLIAPRGLPNAS